MRLERLLTAPRCSPGTWGEYQCQRRRWCALLHSEQSHSARAGVSRLRRGAPRTQQPHTAASARSTSPPAARRTACLGPAGCPLRRPPPGSAPWCPPQNKRVHKDCGACVASAAAAAAGWSNSSDKAVGRKCRLLHRATAARVRWRRWRCCSSVLGLEVVSQHEGVGGLLRHSCVGPEK